MSDVKSATVIPQPQRLSVSETKEGLVQIEIQLRKRKITVTEQNFFSRIRRGNLIGSLYDEFNPVSQNGDLPKEKSSDQLVLENLITEVWAPLKSCSTGDVPDKDEFLLMPEADMEFWIATAKELGVEFQWLDDLQKILTGESIPPEQEKKEKAQKKSRTRKPSSNT